MQVEVRSRVYFENAYHTVKTVNNGKVLFVSDLQVSAEDPRPRFETLSLLADLRWSDELQAFYLWGRLLGKGRGGAGVDQRAIVAELRDRGLLPARDTRRPGQPPAGGEHVNLCCTLFVGDVDWAQELARLRRGDGFSPAAQAAIDRYKERFKLKLTEGFADPDADDSWTEGEE